MLWIIWIALVALVIIGIIMSIRKMSGIERDARHRFARSKGKKRSRDYDDYDNDEETEDNEGMFDNVAKKLKMFGRDDDTEESKAAKPNRNKVRPIERQQSNRPVKRNRRWKIILEDRVMTDVHEFIFLNSVGIGRKKDLTNYDDFLVVNDSRVSSIHCAIISDGEHLRIHDEGSRNHTFLNGRRIEKPRILQKEDVISLGETRLEVVKIMRET